MAAGLASGSGAFARFPRVAVWPMSGADVRARSSGEVTTAAPSGEPGGLYDPAIFGEDPGHGCECGAVVSARDGWGTCAACGGAVGALDARTERFGHIALAEPVVHPWLLTARPSPLALVTGLRHRDLARIALGDARVVLEPGDSALPRGAVISHARHRALAARHTAFRAESGAAALDGLWRAVDPGATTSAATRGKRTRSARRAAWLRALGAGPLPPVLIDAVLVLPPGLRGPHADVLDHRYRLVLAANERVRRDPTDAARTALALAVVELLGPAGVGAVLGQGPRSRAVEGSARAPVAPDPTLAHDACALPRWIALELFAPTLLARRLAAGLARDVHQARSLLAVDDDPSLDAELATLVAERPVLLARDAPRRRDHVAAFAPVLSDGTAVRLHPSRIERLGGEPSTVRVFVASSTSARDELATLARRDPSPQPPHGEALLGLYWATREPARDAPPTPYRSLDAVAEAFARGDLAPTSPVLVDGTRTTAGRALVLRRLPPTLRPGAIDRPLTDRACRALLASAAERLPPTEVARLATGLWTVGLELASHAPSSLAIEHLAAPPIKRAAVAEAMGFVRRVADEYDDGQITDGERYNKVVDVWATVADYVQKDVGREISRQSEHPLGAIAAAGDHATLGRVRRLAGMVGLESKPNGEIVERSVVASLGEGLGPHEWFLCATKSRGERVSGLDHGRRARALTGELVRALGAVRIVADDCGTTEGRALERIEEHGEVVETLGRRALGWVALRDVVDASGGVLLRAGERIDGVAAERIDAAGIESAHVRWAPACRARGGVCRLCHGEDGAVGDAVGTRAALAVGEASGLRTRVFHIC